MDFLVLFRENVKFSLRETEVGVLVQISNDLHFLGPARIFEENGLLGGFPQLGSQQRLPDRFRLHCLNVQIMPDLALGFVQKSDLPQLFLDLKGIIYQVVHSALLRANEYLFLASQPAAPEHHLVENILILAISDLDLADRRFPNLRENVEGARALRRFDIQ